MPPRSIFVQAHGFFLAMLMSGCGWVQEERATGNPVAGLITRLSLAANRISLLLPNWLEDGNTAAAEEPDQGSEDEDEEQGATSCAPTVRAHLPVPTFTQGDARLGFSVSDKPY